MKKLLWSLVVVVGLALVAHSGGFGGGAGFGSAVSGGSVTNTASPAWLGGTQTIVATNGDSTITVNPTNGVYCSLFLTNALTSNVVVTLDFTGASTNLVPLWLSVLHSPTVITDVTTNIGPNTNTITVAGLTDYSGEYAGVFGNLPNFWFSHAEHAWTVLGYGDAFSVGNPGDFLIETGGGYVVAYTGNGSVPTGSLAAVNTRWIWGNSGDPDGAYLWSAGNSRWECTSGYYIKNDEGTLNVYDAMDSLVAALSTYSNFYPTQESGTADYPIATNMVTNVTTYAYALAWSTNCQAENGSVRALQNGASSYFVMKYGATNIVAGASTNLSTVVNP